MKILQRLRNLWRLSEYQVPAVGRKHEVGDLIVPELYKPVEKPRKAQIIRMKSDEQVLKELLEDK